MKGCVYTKRRRRLSRCASFTEAGTWCWHPACSRRRCFKGSPARSFWLQQLQVTHINETDSIQVQKALLWTQSVRLMNGLKTRKAFVIVITNLILRSWGMAIPSAGICLIPFIAPTEPNTHITPLLTNSISWQWNQNQILQPPPPYNADPCIKWIKNTKNPNIKYLPQSISIHII
jgi:hypothetical protein